MSKSNTVVTSRVIRFTPIPEEAELYTLSEFVELVDLGAVNEYDGDGYYTNPDKGMSDVSVWSSIGDVGGMFPEDFPQIAWISK